MTDGIDDIDCSKVVTELYTFLDGELTAELRQRITNHLDGCVDCHEVVDFHAELKMVIAQRCQEQLPAGLRDRIEQVLAQETGDTSGGGISRF